VIGRGAFGTVYKATWAGTPVAVKVIRVRNASVSSELENEVAVHSLVRHPNIIQIMGVSFIKNLVYIISELIDGKNLDDILFEETDADESVTLNMQDKFFVSRQLCQAVAYLHNLKPQVLHTLDPANVLVANVGLVTKLCDMVLSKLKNSQTLTHTAAACPGTPHYLSPDFLLNRNSASASSDVWSLACTLIELFTGKYFW
ncbi:predicted protein, partial [Nematostella vectensis]